jgi:hypothetical protein
MKLLTIGPEESLSRFVWRQVFWLMLSYTLTLLAGQIEVRYG